MPVATSTAPTSRTVDSTSTEPTNSPSTGSESATSAAQATSTDPTTVNETETLKTSSVPSSTTSSSSSSDTTQAVEACDSSKTLAPGDSTKSVEIDGNQREFLIHVPASYSSDTHMPVVIDFHPLGGSGSQWKAANAWGAKADAEGFIMVWPTGVGNSWNVGMCCSTARTSEVDDVAFTRGIISALEGEGCIDTKRVYATGCSNGGGMAYKVACDAADVIAAVAPVDFDCVVGPDATNACASCSPERPISEIQFRGTNDTAVPFTGGPGPRGEVTFPGARANFERWADINACTGEAAALDGHEGCMTYSDCGSDVETTLCTVQNGAHCGSYGSFGIIDIAWERLAKSSL
jgi:polyhydroxybutyrate depolymerase